MTELFWGVDLSTKYIAIGVVGEGRFTANRVALNRPAKGRIPNAPAFLWDTRRRLITFARAYAGHSPPVSVLVERPTGANHNPILMQTAGVVMEALHEVLAPVIVGEVPVKSWKRDAVGWGNADKQQTLEWARSRGYSGDSFDESDALGIAECCRLDVQSARAAA